MPTPAIGSPAPEFAACNSADLSRVTDADFKGKKTVLAFFPAAFSGNAEQGCEMQLCGLNSLVAAAGDGVQFFGVSSDLPFANAAFAKKIGISYPLLSDPSLKSCARYVGTADMGAFLKQVGVTDALEATTSSRGCVVLDEQAKVVFATSGDGNPGAMPKLADIKAALGL